MFTAHKCCLTVQLDVRLSKDTFLSDVFCYLLSFTCLFSFIFSLFLHWLIIGSQEVKTNSMQGIISSTEASGVLFV